MSLLLLILPTVSVVVVAGVEAVVVLGLLDYGKNHNHDYFWSIIDITIY